VVVHARISAVVPGISSSALQQAVAFAVEAMRQTRDAYHEPVALQEVSIENSQMLLFKIRTLFTHNTCNYKLDFAPGNMYDLKSSV
jgi:hypothetical protein